MAELFDPDGFVIEPSATGRLLCGGCAPDNACRLGVEVAGTLDGAERFDVICARSWHGGPEVAHGGWIAAVFDDVLNMVALRSEPRLVTKSLAVSYLRPVPVERPLTVLGWIDTHSGSRWEVSARMALAPAGPDLATARAELRTRRPDHYAQHADWLARQPLPRNGIHTES
ncbi:PaaI family thioesterase [Saccharopolyspora phatthalungensis]|uniref:Acyl-coenzyme A thioesterase PaaI-like protein n=1 Tax=Saccharopolyspora phatthalungensis TaxID=664693 RepID=A0A840QKF0_9PSEU|nr:hotdog domain-containing protein [Saccharopolyspora phatthalungensis]MBB5159845.1 acyl-coenzyme A thioesterase PaaI-like protein [Saccharopolyspora phatthalungensis]